MNETGNGTAVRGLDLGFQRAQVAAPLHLPELSHVALNTRARADWQGMARNLRTLAPRVQDSARQTMGGLLAHDLSAKLLVVAGLLAVYAGTLGFGSLVGLVLGLF